MAKPPRRCDLLPDRILDAIYELIVSAARDGQAHPMDWEYGRDLTGEIERDLDELAAAIFDYIGKDDMPPGLPEES